MAMIQVAIIFVSAPHILTAIINRKRTMDGFYSRGDARNDTSPNKQSNPKGKIGPNQPANKPNAPPNRLPGADANLLLLLLARIWLWVRTDSFHGIWLSWPTVAVGTSIPAARNTAATANFLEQHTFIAKALSPYHKSRAI